MLVAISVPDKLKNALKLKGRIIKCELRQGLLQCLIGHYINFCKK